jgi:hypothetical protein
MSLILSILPLAPIAWAGFAGWGWANILWMGIITMALGMRARHMEFLRESRIGEYLRFVSSVYAMQLIFVAIPFGLGALVRFVI